MASREISRLDYYQDSDDTARIVEIVHTERTWREEGERREHSGKSFCGQEHTDYIAVPERRMDRSPDVSRRTKRRYEYDSSGFFKRGRVDSLRRKELGRLFRDNITDGHGRVNTRRQHVSSFDEKKGDNDRWMERGDADKDVNCQKSSWVDKESDDMEETSWVRCYSPPQKRGGMSFHNKMQERRSKQDGIKPRFGIRHKTLRQDLGRNQRQRDIGKHDSRRVRMGNDEMLKKEGNKHNQWKDDMGENNDWAENNAEYRYLSNRLPGKQNTNTHMSQAELINCEHHRSSRRSQYDHEKQSHGHGGMHEFDHTIKDSEIDDDHRQWLSPRGVRIQGAICEETLELSTPGQKEDLASIILCTVCAAFDGSIDLKTLKTRLLSDSTVKFNSTRSLYQFLKDYKQVFEIDGEFTGDQEAVEDGEVEDAYDEDNFKVTAKPRLQLCIDHSTKAGSCTKGCESLHICKYFIMSKCDVFETTGRRCLFGHDMDTEHNRAVMRKSLTHMFPAPLGGDILLKLKYRNSTTVPVVCKFYNRPTGCQNPQCRFLHICSKYIRGTCKAGLSCDSQHDIKSDQNYIILCRYGMAPQSEGMKEEIIRILGTIEASQNQQLHIVKTGDSQEPSAICKKSTERRDTTESASDATINDDVDLTSPSDWRWAWQTEDGRWTDVTDNQSFEQGFREYVQAKKMQFSIENKTSEINFATMKGRILGESPLQFKRVKKERVDEKAKTDA